MKEPRGANHLFTGYRSLDCRTFLRDATRRGHQLSFSLSVSEVQTCFCPILYTLVTVES